LDPDLPRDCRVNPVESRRESLLPRNDQILGDPIQCRWVGSHFSALSAANGRVLPLAGIIQGFLAGIFTKSRSYCSLGGSERSLVSTKNLLERSGSHLEDWVLRNDGAGTIFRPVPVIHLGFVGQRSLTTEVNSGEGRGRLSLACVSVHSSFLFSDGFRIETGIEA
jgi:hypothetical protein